MKGKEEINKIYEEKFPDYEIHIEENRKYREIRLWPKGCNSNVTGSIVYVVNKHTGALGWYNPIIRILEAKQNGPEWEEQGKYIHYF